MYKRNTLIPVTAVILVLICCLGSHASSLKERLQADFNPVEAVVTQVSGQSTVLSSSASGHVSKGDLFTIFRKGNPVYMPGSSKVLGYERKRIALCRVSGIRAELFECTVISEQMKPEAGDPAVRFGELNAAFFVEGKPAEPELPEGSLKDILPWFKWLEPSAQPSPVATPESMKALGIDILFQVEGDSLQVLGPDMEKFRSYGLSPSFVFIQQKKSATAAGQAERPDNYMKKEVFDFSRAKLVGSLDHEVIQASICDLDGDGRLEIIYLLKNEICIAPYRRQGQVVSLKFGDFSTVCNFSLMEHAGWLCVNAALGQAGMSSKLLKYEEGSLRLIQDQINLWLGFVDTDCDGNKDTLLGQTYERARFRGRKIFRLAATDSGIEYMEKTDYPPDFNVNSATSANMDGEGCFLFYVSFDGFFKVYGNEKHLWSSLKPVVRDTKCCGPARADLVNLSLTGLGQSGIIFNGIMPLPKGRMIDSLILFLRDGGQSALYQAGLNLNGRICSICLVGQQVLMAVINKDQETGKTVTSLLAFSGTE